MKTFKEFRKTSLPESNYLDYYREWGLISPSGNAVTNPKLWGHDTLAAKQGFMNVRQALDSGWVRYVIAKRGGDASFELASPKGMTAMIKFLKQHHLEGSVMVELGIPGINQHKIYEDQEQALRHINVLADEWFSTPFVQKPVVGRVLAHA